MMGGSCSEKPRRPYSSFVAYAEPRIRLVLPIAIWAVSGNCTQTQREAIGKLTPWPLRSTTQL